MQANFHLPQWHNTDGQTCTALQEIQVSVSSSRNVMLSCNHQQPLLRFASETVQIIACWACLTATCGACHIACRWQPELLLPGTQSIFGQQSAPACQVSLKLPVCSLVLLHRYRRESPGRPGLLWLKQSPHGFHGNQHALAAVDVTVPHTAPVQAQQLHSPAAECAFALQGTTSLL